MTKLIQLKDLESDKSLVFIQSSDEKNDILDNEGLSDRKEDFRYLVVKEINGELKEIYGFLTPYTHFHKYGMSITKKVGKKQLADLNTEIKWFDQQ